MILATESNPISQTLKQVGVGDTASGQDGMAVLGEAQKEGTGGTTFDKLKAAYVTPYLPFLLHPQSF